jgi:hypothetical protein
MAKKKASAIKFKKAPCAPKRFKSAYMFYSVQQHKEIRDQSVDKKVGDALLAIIGITTTSSHPMYPSSITFNRSELPM